MGWLLATFARLSERIAVWHRWPFLLATAIIVGHRVSLRNNNLADTETAPPKIDPPEGFDLRNNRTIDGSFNDLGAPWMGSAGARFGRNLPLEETFAETDDVLMDPSPRLVSNKLLKRKEFVPVPHLNVLAAAWIQFMVHDWVSHGPNDKSVIHDVPLPEGDDWPGGKMGIARTGPDTKRSDADDGRPKAWRNAETHWWDGSQVYGSTEEKNRRIRTKPGAKSVLPNGKLWLDAGGLLPLDETKADGQELAGVNGNWWIGLSILHTLFAREHNAIVDRLKIDHYDKSGEWLFHKARLVNSALMAKIHTVEWTPALMDSPKGRMLMRGNYWGLLGEHLRKTFGRASDSEVISGIPGSPKEHHGIPFAMTEEFVACYRMHSLLPDDFAFHSHEDDTLLHEADLTAVTGPRTRALYDRISFDDAVYSLSVANPGALVLNNFPKALRRIDRSAEGRPDIDLASIDILRDRERGMPRFKKFRSLVGAKAPETFADITDDTDLQAQLKEVYGTVDKVDLLIGTLAEAKSKNGTPHRFGFSDTVFRIFILMASRRLKSDRFYTDDFRPEIYTQAGFDWVTDTQFSDVVQRHCQPLQGLLADARNPFFPWRRAQR